VYLLKAVSTLTYPLYASIPTNVWNMLVMLRLVVLKLPFNAMIIISARMIVVTLPVDVFTYPTLAMTTMLVLLNTAMDNVITKI